MTPSGGNLSSLWPFAGKISPEQNGLSCIGLSFAELFEGVDGLRFFGQDFLADLLRQCISDRLTSFWIQPFDL